MTDASDLWARASLAVACLGVDPGGLGGLWLRARSGPVRDRLLAAITAASPLPVRRIHPTISDEALFGGVDLAATLAKGGLVRSTGILGAPALLLLPMAERATPGLAARLALALGQGHGHGLVALDEGAEPDERLAPALTDRLGLHLDLSDLPMGDCPDIPVDRATLAEARALLPQVQVARETLDTLTRVAARLGIDSLRAPLLALRLARASAALMGEDAVTEDDLTLAIELVLAPRATQIPEAPAPKPDPEPEAQPDPPEPQPDEDTQGAGDDQMQIPEELLLEAARAVLPADLLARLAAAKSPRSPGAAGGTGAAKRGNRRGRPLPSRPGTLDGDHRIDLVATLRVAAPWQRIRAQAHPDRSGLHIRPDDIRIRQFEEKSDRLLIFAVDASGSAAFSRLAEAKGAVELLLAEAYARRDQVALIAFRGTEAEVLLPPTRSLVQTKRRLSALPGGGGTPLAAGLRAAMELAQQTKGRGLTPTIAVLTDGRANIALNGTADRAQAREDAETLGRVIRAQGVPALVIDMGNRPQPQLRELSATMGATYLPLPRADAQRLSTAVTAALEV